MGRKGKSKGSLSYQVALVFTVYCLAFLTRRATHLLCLLVVQRPEEGEAAIAGVQEEETFSVAVGDPVLHRLTCRRRRRRSHATADHLFRKMKWILTKVFGVREIWS